MAQRSTRPDEPDDEERSFLAGYDPRVFERPSLAVDVALLTVESDGTLATLVTRRDVAPAKGRWSLPGTFVRIDETLETAAARALSAKCGLDDVYLEQLYTFGALRRDPRTRVVTVAYYALVHARRLAEAKSDAKVARIEVPWEGETGGDVEVVSSEGARLPMAFDHGEILGTAVKRIRGKLDYTPIGFQLLPDRFTLAALQHVHETVLNRPLNKDSFRRRMLASGQLEATGDREEGVDHRPPELYRFARRSAV